jgi:hypothetical protein
MERRMTIRTGVLACLLVMTLMVGPLWAGGTQSGFEPPPDNAIKTGPEIWGVVVIYCTSNDNFATVRVKRVVDCNTEVISWVEPAWNPQLCPDTAEEATNNRVDLMQARLTSEWGTTGTPYIEKVKNFDREYDQVQEIEKISFDAMFKFFTVP